MEIRQGFAEDMLKLWQEPKSTSEFFCRHLNSGTAEFWMLTENRTCIGELYFFKDLPQKELADGCSKAYLCAFRVLPSHQGKGYGSYLMRHVLERIRSLGFSFATIGAEICEVKNIRMYRHFGFDTDILRSIFDPCDIDETGAPCAGNEIQFMSRAFI